MVENQVIVTHVPAGSILANWGSISGLIERVTQRVESGYSPFDVMQKLLNADYQLWKVNDWEAAAVTQISILPQFKSLHINFLAGDNAHDWLPALVDTLDEFGRQYDCQRIDFSGRRGWLKVAKPLGFNEELVVMRRHLDGRQGTKGTDTTG